MNRNKKYRTRLALAETLDFACRITRHNFCMVLGKWGIDLKESVYKKPLRGEIEMDAEEKYDEYEEYEENEDQIYEEYYRDLKLKKENK